MKTPSEFDRHAAAWLADGPTELADRVLDAALSEVHSTRQRRGPAALWRFPRMNAFLRLQTAALVAFVLVAGALVFVGPQLGPGGTRATPEPTPAGTAACGHELGRGLYLTAGCTYRTSDFQPPLTIVSDGAWVDAFQTPDALDFSAIDGPALNTTVRLRPLRSVLTDPCEMGSSDRRPSTPGTSRAYLDWLGAFKVEATQAVAGDALGMHGWRFDTGWNAIGPTPNPEDPCAFVSLSEPTLVAAGGSTESVVIDQYEMFRVYVLDSPDGVFLVILGMTDQPASAAAGEAFLAGIQMQP